MFKFLIKILLTASIVFTIGAVSAQYSNVNDIKVNDVKTEEHDEKKLEKVLNDYNDSQKKSVPTKEVAKDVTDEELTDEELREFDEFAIEAKEAEARLKNLPDYKKGAVPKNVEGRKLSENITFMLDPLRKLGDQELEELLRERIKESGAAKLYDLEPRIYPFTVKLIKDKEAVPSLIRIGEDTSRLTKLLWLILGSFIVGYFLKRITSNKDQPFVTAVIFGLLRMTFMTGLRLYLVWWIFGPELKPAIRIAKEVFFS